MRRVGITFLALGLLTVAADPVAVARTAHDTVTAAPAASMTDAVSDAAPLAVATVLVLAPLGDLLEPGHLPDRADIDQTDDAARQAL